MYNEDVLFVFWNSTIIIIIVHGFNTTLDGPFKPETAPLNPIALDLPESGPSFVEPNSKFQPEQISVSLSYSFDSVWNSWVTVTVLFDSLTFFFIFFPVNLNIYQNGRKIIKCSKFHFLVLTFTLMWDYVSSFFVASAYTSNIQLRFSVHKL